MATNQNGDEYCGEAISREEIEAAQVTAYALGQLQGEERVELERRLGADGEGANQREIREVESIAAAVSFACSSDGLPKPDGALRNRIEKELAAPQSMKPVPAKVELADRSRWLRWPTALEWCVIAGVCCLLVALLMPAVQSARESSRQAVSYHLERLRADVQTIRPDSWDERRYAELRDGVSPEIGGGHVSDPLPYAGSVQRSVKEAEEAWRASAQGESDYHRMLARNPKSIKGGEAAVVAVPQPGVPGGAPNVQFHSLLGDLNDSVAVGNDSKRDSDRWPESLSMPGDQAIRQQNVAPSAGFSYFPNPRRPGEGQGSEQYDPILENAFLSPLQQPLSTFSIDVDTASYANMRRFLTSGRLPPRNSVRIEELVNYFRYEYPQPKGNEPFSVNMEVAECPWRAGHLLLRVGLKGKEAQRSERPASNLVFLLDVSGSMSDENKLPLLKTAIKMLAGELGENDRVSIVTYAGDAGLKLKSTRGNQQSRITRAIDSLSAGGSTNGSAGIELAYEQATANFIRGGTNRVILCTDGDLNVGVTSDEALTKLIKQKATSGVFLTVLGFGEGNLKDAKMEKLADNGNGLYAYIDSVREARKVLVEQLTGSTITIAKDVKIQIEFNPAQIAAYRLLGYENRVMAAQDFNNDKKDAGEIGAGHTVTALYELVPVGATDEAVPPRAGTDPLKYQGTRNGGADAVAVGGFGGGVGGGEGVGGGFGGGVQESGKLTDAAHSGELLTLKLRYKEPEGETSKLLEVPLKDRGHSFHSASPDMQFAAAVASFGMILRGSQHRGSATVEGVAEIASAALGKDEGGYRAEFVDLVHKAKALGAR